MIPDYDVVVIDEAHELIARVTQAATDELWASEVERAARRSTRPSSRQQRSGRRADDAADALRDAIGEARRAASTRSPTSSPTRWRSCAMRRAP